MLVDILLALTVCLIVGTPAVIIFDKWKKEIEAEDEEGADDERSE